MTSELTRELTQIDAAKDRRQVACVNSRPPKGGPCSELTQASHATCQSAGPKPELTRELTQELTQ